MNKRKILSIALILVLSISVFAFGDDHVTKIEAFLAGDLNFNVDGEQWIPKDTDGSELTPIIYKDRTYIPVRSLLEDKGVTVDYEASTRTVLIDYSTIEYITAPPIILDAPAAIKDIDKASPLLMKTLTIRDDDSDGDGIDDGTEYKELTIEKNPNFDIDSMAMTQELSFDLNNAASIKVDGETLSGSIDEIIKSNNTWKSNSAVLSINQETGEVEELKISTESGDNSSDGSTRLDIEITIKLGEVTITIIIYT